MYPPVADLMYLSSDAWTIWSEELDLKFYFTDIAFNESLMFTEQHELNFLKVLKPYANAHLFHRYQKIWHVLGMFSSYYIHFNISMTSLELKWVCKHVILTATN